MKVIFNIAKIIDIDILDKKLNKFEDLNGYTPIILANTETLTEICKSDFETIIIHGDVINKNMIKKYKGCKFFIDNEKNFGEIELR